MKFNVLEHKLVPEHRILSDKEAEAILTKLKVSKDQLPKIRKDDPTILVLEKVHGPITEGSIIKITRLSDTAGISEAFRLVIGR